MSVIDFLHLGSSLSLRSLARIGSSGSVRHSQTWFVLVSY
jgi:hypothetical protein